MHDGEIKNSMKNVAAMKINSYVKRLIICGEEKNALIHAQKIRVKKAALQLFYVVPLYGGLVNFSLSSFCVFVFARVLFANFCPSTIAGALLSIIIVLPLPRHKARPIAT